jgi:hypothetical protein
MDENEERWLRGSTEGLAQEKKDEIQWPINDYLDGDDLIYLSVTVGLLAAIIPSWSGGISMALGMISSSWLLVFAGVFFVGGTVLNLRNPIGIVGQILGVMLFLMEVGVQYTQHADEDWFDIGGPGWGLLFAVVSIVLCFFALMQGGYDEEDFDQ